jgi:hypothetical protein
VYRASLRLSHHALALGLLRRYLAPWPGLVRVCVCVWALRACPRLAAIDIGSTAHQHSSHIPRRLKVTPQTRPSSRHEPRRPGPYNEAWKWREKERERQVIESTLAVRRRPPGHTQYLKDPLLALPFHEPSVRNTLPPLPSHHVHTQSPLIEPHSFLAGEQTHAAVEYVVSP